MNTIKLFSLLLVVFAFSCSNIDDLNNYANEKEAPEALSKFGFPGVGATWLSGTSCVVSGNCFALGSCSASASSTDLPSFGSADSGNGTPVHFTMRSPNEMHVELLSASTTIEEIQELLNANPDVNDSAQDIYDAITSSVPIEEIMPLGVELSQQLSANSNGLIILPGEYPVNYSDSAFGEFVVSVQEN